MPFSPLKAKLRLIVDNRLSRIFVNQAAAYIDNTFYRKYIVINKKNAEFLLAKRSADSAEGWLLDAEGPLLYSLALNCVGKGAIVEIGSWKGKSTIYLGKGSKAGNTVTIYAVDPHTGGYEHKLFGEVATFEEFNSNIINAGIADIVTPIVKTSEEAASNFTRPCELVFIDGSHEYQFVRTDFELWFPKLVDGGIMAFHDTLGWEGPRKVVTELLFKSMNFKNIGFVQSIVFGEKVGKNSRVDRLRNRCVLFLHKLRALIWNVAAI
jgi:predicted O-methyltransferase YrrM